MNHKKLILINLLTLTAFIFVVGVGIYQAEAMKNKYGKEKPVIEDKEQEEMQAETEGLEIVSKKETVQPLHKKRETVGSQALRNIDFLALREEAGDRANEVYVDLEDTHTEIHEETIEMNSGNTVPKNSPPDELVSEKNNTIKESDKNRPEKGSRSDNNPDNKGTNMEKDSKDRDEDQHQQPPNKDSNDTEDDKVENEESNNEADDNNKEAFDDKSDKNKVEETVDDHQSDHEDSKN